HSRSACYLLEAVLERLPRALLILDVRERPLHGVCEESQLATDRGLALVRHGPLEILEHGSQPAHHLELLDSEMPDLVDGQTDIVLPARPVDREAHAAIG